MTRLGQLADEARLVRELSRFVLGVHKVAVHLHVEDAAPAGDQLRVDAERLFQTGSQTDRFGLVVSDVAVGDGDFHGAELPVANRVRR